MQTKAAQDLFQKNQFLFIHYYFYMSGFLQMALMHDYIRVTEGLTCEHSKNYYLLLTTKESQ